jgi:hypothetical protein
MCHAANGALISRKAFEKNSAHNFGPKLQQEDIMPLFITQGRYTQDAVKGMLATRAGGLTSPERHRTRSCSHRRTPFRRHRAAKSAAAPQKSSMRAVT